MERLERNCCDYSLRVQPFPSCTLLCSMALLASAAGRTLHHRCLQNTMLTVIPCCRTGRVPASGLPAAVLSRHAARRAQLRRRASELRGHRHGFRCGQRDARAARVCPRAVAARPRAGPAQGAPLGRFAELNMPSVLHRNSHVVLNPALCHPLFWQLGQGPCCPEQLLR